MKPLFLLSLFSVFGFFDGISQNSKIDSLYNELKKTQHDTTVCRLYIELGYEYDGLNTDSSYYYVNKSLVLAEKENLSKKQSSALTLIGTILRRRGDYEGSMEVFIKAIRIDEKLGDLFGQSKNYNNIGLIYKDQGNYEKAIEYLQKSMDIKRALNNQRGIASSLVNIGIVYRYQGLFDKAIDQYIQAIKILEELNDKDGVGKCYNNIGNLHYSQQNFEKALNYFEKSLDVARELNDMRGISRSLNNIAIIYRKQSNFTKAIEYYEEAIKISDKLDDQKTLSIIYNNLGSIYRLTADFDKALEYLLIAMNIREKIGDKQGLASSYLSIAEFYNSLADSTSKDARYPTLNQAIKYGLLAYNISSEIGALPSQLSATNILKESYAKLNRFEKALYYANIQLDLADSLNIQNKNRAVTEIETKYETEKKQQEIEKQRLIIERNIAHSQKQRNRIISLIFGSVFLSLLAITIYLSYRQKSSKNRIITEKNAILEQYNEEIKATSEALSEHNERLKIQNDEIIKQRNEIELQKNSLANLAWELQERKEEIEAQKDVLTFQNNEITSSIIYAQRIQSAVLPSENYLNDLFSDFFILYKPKSIVSGDFYWATKIRNLIVFCVIDCTGHGVPGAFMSMMGVSFLNEIVAKEQVTNAAEVLNQLRNHVVNSMRQTSDSYEPIDGMDIGLCVLNTQTFSLQFAGANIPCWIATKAEKLNNKSLVELKPDSMPIARYERMEPFSLAEYQLKENDKIYLATDGFADQFGGSEGKKFQKSRLMKVLAQNSHNALSEQKNILEATFEEWKNCNTQVDDVTVLGIKV